MLSKVAFHSRRSVLSSTTRTPSSSPSLSSSVLRSYFSKPTHPVLGKVEIFSLGTGTNNGDGNGPTKGILKQVLPVGTNVYAGDVIGLVQVQKEQKNDNDKTESDEVSIYSPQTGTITNIIATIQDEIQIGDYLLEIDDTIENDIDAWMDHLQMNHGKMESSFLKQYLELNDIFRLQQLPIMIREKMPLLLQFSIPIYERILELQTEQNKGLQELARTRTDLGILLYNLGDPGMAKTQLEYALELRTQVYGKDSNNMNNPEIAASHIHLGAIEKAMGNIDAALDHMQKALQIQVSHMGGNDTHPAIASSYNNIGSMLMNQGKFKEAIDNYEKALTILKTLHSGEKHPDVAGTIHNIGLALEQTGDIYNATEKIQQALQLRRELFGDQSDNVAVSHYALGHLMTKTQELKGALEQFEAGLTIQQKLHGEDSAKTSTGYNNVGSVYYQQQNFDQALVHYTKALENLQKDTPDSPDVAACMNNVGLVLYRKGQFEDSLKHHQKALLLLEKHFGKGHPALAMTIGSIGNIYKMQNKLDDALIQLKIANQILEEALGPNHPDVASSYNSIGLILIEQNKLDDALTAYRAANESFRASLGPNHPHTASCHFNIGLVLQSKKKLVDAKKEFEQAKTIWEHALGKEHGLYDAVTQKIQECS